MDALHREFESMVRCNASAEESDGLRLSTVVDYLKELHRSHLQLRYKVLQQEIDYQQQRGDVETLATLLMQRDETWKHLGGLGT